MYNKIKILVGFVKNKTIEKANYFKPTYFLTTIANSEIVGVATGILVIENLYKN